MKKRFAAQLNAVVLAIGIYCLNSSYPCLIHVGETTGKTCTAAIQGQKIPTVAVQDIFYTESDTRHTEKIRAAAMACIASLGDEKAVIPDGTRRYIDTGVTGDYETAQEVYAASKDWYYGNIGYSMDYIRLGDGNVRLVLKMEYGTSGQAYREHLEAKSRLEQVASSFFGTDEEKAYQIFEWVCSHVSYADDKTVSRIQETKPGGVPDYNGIYATAYTAVMNGITTCDGFSGMLLALFEKSGIPAAKVQNGQHAYNIALIGGHWVLYDAASGISGDPEEYIQRYADYYVPQRLTCGYGTIFGLSGERNDTGNVCLRQKTPDPET